MYCSLIPQYHIEIIKLWTEVSHKPRDPYNYNIIIFDIEDILATNSRNRKSLYYDLIERPNKRWYNEHFNDIESRHTYAYKYMCKMYDRNQFKVYVKKGISKESFLDSIFEQLLIKYYIIELDLMRI